MNLKGKRVHLMGICGTAMASLAGLFKSMGAVVSGSDQNIYPPMSTQIEKLGIQIQRGYKKENLVPRPDLVIVGNVIRRDYEEAQALLASDIPYTSLPKAIGEYVIENRHSVVIAGTHGKTTTTSMMAWTAETCKKTPGFLIGGIPKNFEFSFKIPSGDFFVIEGDEYDTAFFDKVPKFIHYRPRSVILTSVEFDHADIYKDLEDVKKSFFRLAELVPQDGYFVYWAENENVLEVAKTTQAKKIPYGLERGDYQAKNISFEKDFCLFDVFYHEKKLDRVRLKVFGKHNILNALATYALAKELDWEMDLVKKSFETFLGVKRRQEIIGEPHGITIIEDFAHHPTAVLVTIEAIKERYKNQKVFAIFEPRSATSRRNFFQNEYAKAFESADVVILPDVFHAELLKEQERLSPQMIVKDLKKKGKNAYLIPKVDEIVSFLKKEAKSSDVILIMSNGAFDGIYQKLLSTL